VTVPRATLLDVEDAPNLVYAVHDGEELRADAWLPAGAGPFPGFVLLHGGAFTKGSRSSYEPWGRYLAARGYVCLSADYRLARPGRTTYPEALWDAKAAVQFVRGMGPRLKVDPGRIGALGGSAGAYLAAMVALTSAEPDFTNPYDDEFAAEDAGVSVAVPMAGTFDMIRRWQFDRAARPADEQVAETFLGGTPFDQRRRYYEASPLFHASAQNARRTKWLIAWGTEDDVTPPGDHSVALAEQLKLAGAVVRLVPIVGAPHFWYMDSDPDEPASYSGHMADRLIGFLRTWSRWHDQDR
jgi:acetyl esterase/lipase